LLKSVDGFINKGSTEVKAHSFYFRAAGLA